MKTAHNLLNTIPDFVNWEEAILWMQEGQQLAAQLTPQDAFDAEIQSLEWRDIEQKGESPFGLFASENWRKFVLATFLADIVSYQNPSDQVNFDRLLYVMHCFPQGFRTWWIKFANGTWWPVGYTGWYPMLDTMYDLFEQNPGKLKDRMVVPNVSSVETSPYIYLFNYSVAPPLKESGLSSMLMKCCVQDVTAQNAKGLACITVSEDGVRIAQRFGMQCSGYLNLSGNPEGIYTLRISGFAKDL